MAGSTAELGLATATDTDDIEVYNVTNLAAALVLLDGLFSASAGHDHSGAHRGKPIPASGLAQPLALTSPVLTTPTLNSPSLTSPTITAGGLTVTAGGLTINAGTVNFTGATVIANLPFNHLLCSGAVSLSVNGTWFAVTGCAVNVVAGTYLITAHAEFSSSGTGANLVEARVYDGTTFYGQAGSVLNTTAGVNWTSVTISAVVTVVGAQTLALQCAFNGAGTQAISVNQISPVSGATATMLNVLRIA